jgi:hypothetical protein
VIRRTKTQSRRLDADLDPAVDLYVGSKHERDAFGIFARLDEARRASSERRRPREHPQDRFAHVIGNSHCNVFAVEVDRDEHLLLPSMDHADDDADGDDGDNSGEERKHEPEKSIFGGEEVVHRHRRSLRSHATGTYRPIA